MNHRKSEVEETSVIPNPFSLWCGNRNHGLKYASVLPTVGAEIGLEPLLSSFDSYSHQKNCRIFFISVFYSTLGIWTIDSHNYCTKSNSLDDLADVKRKNTF